MKRYMIYCSAGVGGLFLATVFAQLLGYNVKANFSATGHAHDMGRGNWKGASSVCFIGDHWHINYRPNYKLYYAHQLPDNFIKNNPDIKLVKITAEPRDYRKITELYVKKAWPDIWTEEEYQKWASPEYPPYGRDNILESELVCNDLVNDLLRTNTMAWYKANADITADYTVKFRTIMGLDDQNLVGVVAQIVGKPVDQSIELYVEQYQQMNKQLYFKNYV